MPETSPLEEVTGAQVLVRRTVAWHETDAAGHNHFAAAFRWLEEAEHRLYRCLDFDPALIERIPRVHIEVDYRDRLYFGQVIDVMVGVIAVGRSSCTFAFGVRTASGDLAVEGRYVIVHAASTSDGAAPWPDALRSALGAPSAHVVDLVGP